MFFRIRQKNNNRQFNDEQLVFVKGWIGKEVQWQELNVFFEEFSIKEVGIEQYLLLKKIKVIGQEYQFVIVTVDGSILCILPSNKLKVLAHVTKAKAIRKQQIVEIDILQEGFLWNKVEKLSFTLENVDTAEEFIEVIEHAKHLLVQNDKN